MAPCLDSAERLSPTLLPKAEASVPHPLPGPSSPLGRTHCWTPFSFWTNMSFSWFTPYMKWCVSILSSSSKKLYLFQLGKSMKRAILFPLSAVAGLLSVKYLSGCGPPSGISQTVGYGLQGLEEFLSQGRVLTHRLFLVKSCPSLSPRTRNPALIFLFLCTAFFCLLSPLCCISGPCFCFPVTTRSSLF